ncbi:DUF3291 domain-containing protein [Sungkyunkwania multivorans]|uniref:DUF3291 domain-containing protein n=1 Tax=Sungkyunkwania multivorans TaxID=1173618 RepID=A0ABW3CW06_9FLAO
MNLAQLNIARMLAPIDSLVMKDFVDNLDRINALADKSDGFVWRLKGESENATAIRVFEDDFLIINMSVWKDRNALFEYVYASDHVEVFRRKKEWFSNMKEMHMALWFVEEGHVPSPEEAKKRLKYLRQHGETPYAFSFKSKFTPEDLKNYLQSTS